MPRYECAGYIDEVRTKFVSSCGDKIGVYVPHPCNWQSLCRRGIGCQTTGIGYQPFAWIELDKVQYPSTWTWPAIAIKSWNTSQSGSMPLETFGFLIDAKNLSKCGNEKRGTCIAKCFIVIYFRLYVIFDDFEPSDFCFFFTVNTDPGEWAQGMDRVFHY